MKKTYVWAAAAALAIAIAATLPVSAQQAPAPAQAPAVAAGGPPARQGGGGPIRVLFVSKGHDHDREGLMKMLDRLGNTITWTHVEHPAATVFYDPANAKDYDVYLFYEPDLDYLKQTALTLDLARKLPPGSGKRRLVFAPTKYVDAIHLEQERIDFCQLPFEIYKALKPKK